MGPPRNTSSADGSRRNSIVERDPNETTDVASANPAVVERLLKLAEGARKTWGTH